jgi:hypothetical protein
MLLMDFFKLKLSLLQYGGYGSPSWIWFPLIISSWSCHIWAPQAANPANHALLSANVCLYLSNLRCNILLIYQHLHSILMLSHSLSILGKFLEVLPNTGRQVLSHIYKEGFGRG